MVKKIGAIVLALMVVFVSDLMAQEYEHTLDTGDMQVYWTVDGDQIHMKLSAKTEGWVAFGFDPESAMQGADIIIGAVKNGKVKIEDHYGDRKRGHSSDEKLGGKNDVLNPQGMEENGVTTISFSRPLTASEEWDKPIDPSKMSRMMIAYGSGADSFRRGHAFRAVYDINYSTGETQKVK